MATTEARPHGRVITGRIGDPQEGVRQPEPIVLPDAAWLFSRTADRLVALADGHVMGDWLRFMARLARAQQAAVTAMPPVAPSAVADAVAACMPPLAAGAHRRDPAWRSGLAALLDRPGEDALPAQAVEVIAWLRRADAAALEELADGYLGGRPPGGQAGAALYVAASLQAYFSRLAASLPVDQLRLLPQRGRCPVCGAAPVAGVITAAGNAPGVRYLRCGLCATEWNHVRAVCIGCGEFGRTGAARDRRQRRRSEGRDLRRLPRLREDAVPGVGHAGRSDSRRPGLARAGSAGERGWLVTPCAEPSGPVRLAGQLARPCERRAMTASVRGKSLPLHCSAASRCRVRALAEALECLDRSRLRGVLPGTPGGALRHWQRRVQGCC